MDDWINSLIETLGAAGVALLMFLENIFPPIPSELIMPLAGYAAADGRTSLPLVIAAGIAGTCAGAGCWYGLGRWLGEERLKRWARRHGRWITLSPDDIEWLDSWFEKHGGWAIPVGHLLPGIRTLVSIPAGVFVMRPLRFAVLTILGSGIWTSALAIAGWWLGQNFSSVERWLGPVSTTIMAAILLIYIYRVITFRAKTSS
ncbi:DedA family protein [Sphingomonas crocodyli]|uniref:DedA family protein n=1 Tax=Sphingomonas crocodyli TaxID=1979270 RepID=A0A437M5M7_9SPHN|nr:DedA family protein [Sphingomonas crocodyli]RVT93008.1 DedA family protein [Sphingomonas crocodyli]